MTRTPPKSLEQVEKELGIFSDEKQEVVSKRDAPKTLSVEREDGGLYYISYSAGGEVPASLKGLYTTVRHAEQAIKDHEARLEPESK